MKRLTMLWFLLLVLFLNITAQDNFPLAYEIKVDSIFYNKIPNEYWQVLEDEKGKLDYKSVSTAPVANKFHYYDYTLKRETTDYTIHCYWFRYILKNVMEHDAKICLGDTLHSLTPFFTMVNEQSDFYLNQEGKVTHQRNGFLTPWSALNGLKDERLIPIVIKPGEQYIVYRRVYNSYKFFPAKDYKLTVGFFSSEKAMQTIYAISEIKYFEAISNSFTVGVMIFAGFFILFFFINTREKVHLYFSLYLFALGIGRLNIYAEMYHLFFREHPVLYVYIFKTIWFCALFFLVHFIRYLLNTKQFLPKWDRFLVIFNNIFALTYLLFLIISFSSQYRVTLPNIFMFNTEILTLFIPITFLQSIKWIKINKVLTFIILPLQCLWSICFLIFQFGGLQTNWHLIETILLSCLVLSYSWILLHRFTDLKKQIAQREIEMKLERSKIIEQKKIELEEQVIIRTAELKDSLEELKSTQAQLIQSEKMASLGELTAGIAHEIQNPLNFVNNFAEINNELIKEMKEELAIGNKQLEKGEINATIDKLKNAIEVINDIESNSEKINHHGKRAESIVKGMLQHSRKSTGTKEPTDINALADEYLRLSYYGLRAKDKFSPEGMAMTNTAFKLDLDPNLPLVNLIPQDIGRIFLNLFNNAFWAVNEKKKLNIEGYEPLVMVSTKVMTLPSGLQGVEIKVVDNGSGIPAHIIDKIFQPFFTTKPTGQGTGLGLSLAYDIVTKGHGGSIEVKSNYCPPGGTQEEESAERVGSEFQITLPIPKV